MLFECKHHSADLSKVHASQLYRYFSVTEARFGVLTNGVLYQFFSDLDAPNKMDNRPFFEFNLLDIREATVEELKKFSKSAFDPGSILTSASEMKYTREIRRVLIDEYQNPSDDLVKLIIRRVYEGRKTQGVTEQFKQLTKKAFAQFVSDQVNDRLKSALEASSLPIPEPLAEGPTSGNGAAGVPPGSEPSEVQTTMEEMEAFYIVRALLRDIVDVKRIVMRDVHSYCGILLDDNSRKPICRLHFNKSQKYLSLFDGEKETRVPIADVDAIYKYADRLKATVAAYPEPRKGKSNKGKEVLQAE